MHVDGLEVTELHWELLWMTFLLTNAQATLWAESTGHMINMNIFWKVQFLHLKNAKSKRVQHHTLILKFDRITEIDSLAVSICLVCNANNYNYSQTYTWRLAGSRSVVADLSFIVSPGIDLSIVCAHHMM